jgi:hypothetical protein
MVLEMEAFFSFLLFEPFGVVWLLESGPRTPVSRKASSGVRTTVAPVPSAPLRGWVRLSMPRTSLGSEILTGFEGAYGMLAVFGVRESQFMVVASDGLFPCVWEEGTEVESVGEGRSLYVGGNIETEDEEACSERGIGKWKGSFEAASKAALFKRGVKTIGDQC